MNRIKDFLYDINDIIIAVLILAIATLIILVRINTIMVYPELTATPPDAAGGGISAGEPASTGADATATDNETGDNTNTGDQGAAEGDGMTGGTGASVSPDGTVEHTAFSLYIAYGESMSNVGDDLAKLGFFDSSQDFLTALDTRNAGSKVQAGEFVLPANATKDDIIRIITSPPKPAP